MKKRILSAILALVTIICMVPATAYATTIIEFKDDNDITIKEFIDPPTTGQDIFEAFKDDTQVELGDDILTPMGSRVVTLNEASEVFTWSSRDSAVLKTTGFYDIAQDDSDKKGTYFKESNQRAELTSGLDDLCYANGVAFDPTGCGRKNYVAILGFHNTGSKSTSGVYLYVINGDNNRIVGKKAVETSDIWYLINDKGELQLDNVDGKNYFQITAGDYDNDGKDSLVIYYGQPKISEYKLIFSSSDDVTISLANATIISDKTPYLNESYMMVDSSGNAMYNSGLLYRAVASLETGDVNGDGIDDLMVVSCVGDYGQSYLTYYSVRKNNPCIATLAVGFGKTNGSLKTADVVTDKIYDESTSMTVAFPDISIGDIDGDGSQEIVVAGFLNKSTVSDKFNFQNGSVGFTYYKASGTSITQCGDLQVITDISANSKDDSVREDESHWQQFSVECVAFNGLNTKEYIFLNGYVYLLSTNKSLVHQSIKGYDNKEIFSELTNKWKVSGKTYDFNEVYIASAAVGNFYNNANGEQSILLTVGYKFNGSNKYCFADCLIEKRNGELVCSSKHGGNSVSEGILLDKSVYNGSVGNYGVSYIHVAVDIDHDSVVAQYKGSEAFYSDPTVVAFLQAAPYFSEFGAGNSSTKYSYSETYENSSGSGYEFAVGVGITAEAETSFMKAKVEELVSTGITNEFTESRSREYTTVFEANGQNQVVLRRILICTYYYALQNESGEFETNPNNYLAITVPQNPCISTLSLNQYNMYVEYYNEQCAKYAGSYAGTNYFKNTLNKVDDETLLAKYHLTGNEGNPYAYASSINEYENSITMVNDNTWITLGHAGGVTTQEFSYMQGVEEAECTSAGVEVNMELMFGASFAGNGAYAGITASTEYVTTNTKTTSELKTVGTGGTVQNIESDDMADYDFQWQLIGWKAANGDTLFNNDVLFVGYAVKNIKSLPQPVDDLTAKYPGDAEGRVVLKWTSPTNGDGRQEIDHFTIYRKDNTYKKRKVGEVANTGAGKEYTFAIDVSGYNEATTSFFIVCYTADYVESLPSNTVECILALSEAQVKKLIDKAISDLNIGIDDLKTALETKADIADLTKAIEEITSAYKEADKLMASDVEGLEIEISGLSDALSEAQKTLNEAIDAVQENLDKAIADLNNAISDGDSNLGDRIDDLSAAMEAAKAGLEKADADNKAELEKAVSDAENALQAAIQEVQENLDQAKKDLEKAISDGDSDLGGKINDLNAALEAAKAALEKADADSKTALEQTVSDAENALQAAIKKVQDNLDQAKKDLEKAIADNAADFQNKLDELKKAMELADSVNSTTLEELRDKHNAEMEALRKEKDADISDLRAELATLKTLVSDNKAETDATVSTLASVNATQDDHLRVLRTVSYIGLGIAGVSFAANIVLIVQMLLEKKRSIVK